MTEEEREKEKDRRLTVVFDYLLEILESNEIKENELLQKVD